MLSFFFTERLHQQESQGWPLGVYISATPRQRVGVEIQT